MTNMQAQAHKNKQVELILMRKLRCIYQAITSQSIQACATHQ